MPQHQLDNAQTAQHDACLFLAVIAAMHLQVRFYYSFTSKENLYIVMEYLNGGDCFSLLRTLGALDESAARLYVAEAVLALEYCHTQVCYPSATRQPGLTQGWLDNLFAAR